MVSTSLAVAVKQFDWSSRLNCTTKNVDVDLTGGATFRCAEPGRLEACGAEMVDDEVGYFTPSLEVDSLQQRSLHIDVDWDKSAAYDAAGRYPCRVLVRTSRGTRLVDLGEVPPSPRPPDPDELIKAIATHCWKTASPQSKIHALWRLWLPYPGPDQLASLHRWDVAIANAAPSTVLELIDADGHSLVEHVLDARGAGRLRLVRAPMANTDLDGLTVQITAPEQVVHGVALSREVLPAVSIGQTLLVGQDELALSGPATSVVRAGRSAIRLCVVAEDELSTFRTRGTVAMTMTARLRLPGVRGVVENVDGLVAYGDFGLARVLTAGDGSVTSVAPWTLDGCAQHPVVDVVSMAETTAVLTDDRLLLRTRGGRLVTVPVEPGCVLAEWGGRLGVVDPTRGTVRLYDAGGVGRGRSPQPSAELSIPRGALPVDVGRRRAGPRSGDVVSVHAGREGWSKPVARVRRADWSDMAVAIGRRLVRIEPDGTVSLWRTGTPIAARPELDRAPAEHRG